MCARVGGCVGEWVVGVVATAKYCRQYSHSFKSKCTKSLLFVAAGTPPRMCRAGIQRAQAWIGLTRGVGITGVDRSFACMREPVDASSTSEWQGWQSSSAPTVAVTNKDQLGQAARVTCVLFSMRPVPLSARTRATLDALITTRTSSQLPLFRTTG